MWCFSLCGTKNRFSTGYPVLIDNHSLENRSSVSLFKQMYVIMKKKKRKSNDNFIRLFVSLLFQSIKSTTSWHMTTNQITFWHNPFFMVQSRVFEMTVLAFHASQCVVCTSYWMDEETELGRQKHRTFASMNCRCYSWIDDIRIVNYHNPKNTQLLRWAKRIELMQIPFEWPCWRQDLPHIL